ncbi:hypothetical protein DET57_101281 [Klebsiella oxytoca]|uniref:Uncharacterized protein n=1 Tax=Klebsiella oxytoca TaxID=571 RepID=A0A318G5L1_KLEOX|nr:hypothetical protein DET57_101281 [Klebsiella oxytoca]
MTNRMTNTNIRENTHIFFTDKKRTAEAILFLR